MNHTDRALQATACASWLRKISPLQHLALKPSAETWAMLWDELAELHGTVGALQEQIGVLQEQVKTPTASAATPDHRVRDRGTDATKLTDCGLSVRAEMVLQNYGITTVGQLLQCTPARLAKMRNMGRVTIAEINKLIADKGWRQAGSDHSADHSAENG